MAAVDPATACVIVFARAPRPGTVKTRLVPLLGPEGSAALHVRMVKHALATARKAALGAIELHCAPDCDDDFLRFCGERYRVELRAQAGGDLGERRHATPGVASDSRQGGDGGVKVRDGLLPPRPQVDHPLETPPHDDEGDGDDDQQQRPSIGHPLRVTCLTESREVAT